MREDNDYCEALELVATFCAALVVLTFAGVLMFVMAACSAAFKPAAAAPATRLLEYENDVDIPAQPVNDSVTGWSELSMDEQAARIKLAGLVIETVGKVTPKNPITGGFTHSFLRQVGVQMQVQAMYHLDEISHNPAIAFAQGVLIGL